MTEFVTLSCPTCGGKLQITPDIDRFACMHCGNEHIVRRAGGIISLAPVVQELKQVQVGVDKTASELAIKRLREEIEQLQKVRTQIGPPGWMNTVSNWLLWIGGLALFGSLIGLTAIGGNKGETVLTALVSGLMVGGGLYLRSAGATAQQNQRAPIDIEINQRREELVKHESLVKQ